MGMYEDAQNADCVYRKFAIKYLLEPLPLCVTLALRRA